MAGAATGWVAARALPPSDVHPLTMPTIEEIEVLTKKMYLVFKSLQKKLNIDEQDKK